MARQTVRVEGLRELDRALGELPKRTGKAVLRRVLKKASEPLAAEMEAGAPVAAGELKESVAASTKLSARQKRIQKRATAREDKATAEFYVGAGALPQAHLQEFGTKDQPPQPFARPAWDRNKMGILRSIKTLLASEIKKAAERIRKKG
ncbi:hypothetical protein A7A08_01706 [Methyloligella halotolerans]|uniref:Phage protein, HK97 gp10 family n=1 Tax=Methyloligella halotolerans TaxID=1177755 RepID=A0A1E2RZN2_9HYPH|nr:HK97-gp10 family putative phage morphogenesis protein [Methyloligella halotolerans]ODA67671.1 hypothetical protein A7A08_01706 [Methyloligella halotolerans]